MSHQYLSASAEMRLYVLFIMAMRRLRKEKEEGGHAYVSRTGVSVTP